MSHVSTSDWKHELKNQLGIILGFSELLLHELTEGDRSHCDIAEIHTAAERAIALLSRQADPRVLDQE